MPSISELGVPLANYTLLPNDRAVSRRGRGVIRIASDMPTPLVIDADSPYV